jgi:CRP-like cAMP-binding protein
VELPQCALFEALLPSQRDRLQSLMKERRLAAGERLFAQGDAGSGLFVVTRGSISVAAPRRRPPAAFHQFLTGHELR